MTRLEIADLVNSIFVLVSGVFCWLNVRALVAARSVKGVCWLTQLVFALWGWWQLYYYYAALSQQVSGAMTVSIVAANTVWVGLALRYRRRGQ